MPMYTTCRATLCVHLLATASPASTSGPTPPVTASNGAVPNFVYTSAGQSVSFQANSEPVGKVELVGVGATPLCVVSNVLSSQGITSKLKLWRLFELALLNQALADADQRAEKRLGFCDSAACTTAASSSAFTSAYARSESASVISPFTFNFGANVRGKPPTEFLLQLKNTGVITISWRFRFQSKPEVKTESWMDIGEQTEYEKRQLFLLDNSVFTISPLEGTLAPEETAVVRISYSHERVTDPDYEYDEVPVLFHVQHGKRVPIKFLGITLDPDNGAPLLQLASPSATHSFASVGIGAAAAEVPVQSVSLFNPCAVSVEYEVDTAPLCEVTSENHEFTIFDCQNPRGTVPPRSYAQLRFVFAPLEVRQYGCIVPVRVQNGKELSLALCGYGYHPKDESEVLVPEEEQEEELQRTMTFGFCFPGQHACLSQDVLRLGHVPSHARVQRVVMVCNHHETMPLTFKWDCSVSDGVVAIHPDSGMVKAQSSTVCTVTFCSDAAQARIYDIDIPCSVALVSPQNQQDMDLLCSINDDEEAVTAADRDDSEVVAANFSRVTTAMRKKREQSIREVEEQRQRRLQEREQWQLEQRTVPRLFLSVLARTHVVDQFRTAYGAEDSAFERFYIPKAHIPDVREAWVSSAPNTAREGKSEPTTTAHDLISLLLQDIMNDTDIKHALEEPRSKQPIPYFVQLRQQLQQHTGSPGTPTAPSTARSSPGTPSSARSGATLPTPPPASTTSVPAPLLQRALSRKKLEQQGRYEQTTLQEAVTAAAGYPQGQMVTLLRPDFEDLAETVLSGTLSNLIKEAAATEWNIVEPARQLLQQAAVVKNTAAAAATTTATLHLQPDDLDTAAL
eukprot:TRINITY_DN4668_c0_g2_i1.p1 TRINITY_DN4668_c0_g2~~TRINITY_DN4668_c0_g2_i1.p1  ORF type:complete len:851 (-),score=202.56 TRINITY_DN4668_c0_g2_i1:64-2616(-)